MGGDHKCPVCQATFTRPQHVARHMRSHTGDRPYKCQYCGDQFARSDLLSRHINKCHANEKPLVNVGTRRKGSASASRATTSKQACDQCVQSSLPCDGCNPCSKCVQRKCRCTYVKFHRQTAPAGPGHNPHPASSSSLTSSTPSASGLIPLPSSSSRLLSAFPNHPEDDFILGPPPPNSPGQNATSHHLQHHGLGGLVPTSMAETLYASNTFSFPNLYPSTTTASAGSSSSPSTSAAGSSSGVLSNATLLGGVDATDLVADYASKYRSQAELFGSNSASGSGGGSGPGLAGVHGRSGMGMYDPLPLRGTSSSTSGSSSVAAGSANTAVNSSSWLGWESQPPPPPQHQQQHEIRDVYGRHLHQHQGGISVGVGGGPMHDKYQQQQHQQQYMNVSMPYPISVPTSYLSGVQQPRQQQQRQQQENNNRRSESVDTTAMDYSSRHGGAGDNFSDGGGSLSSANSSSVHLPLGGGGGASGQGQGGGGQARGGQGGQGQGQGMYGYHYGLDIPDRAATASTSTNSSSSSHHHRGDSSGSYGGYAPAPDERQEFSSAFGLMSLDDPNVLAGLAVDGQPFFSDPGQAHNQGHDDENPGTGAGGDGGDGDGARSERKNEPASGLLGGDMDTPMPIKRSSGLLSGGLNLSDLGGLPARIVGGNNALQTPSREMDSREMKEFWKQYMRTPLTGPTSGLGDPITTSSGSSQTSKGSSITTGTPYRRQRVSSLPSVKTPVVEYDDMYGESQYNYHQQHQNQQQHQQGHGQQGKMGPMSSIRTTLHGNAEDLRSYEAAVLARKAPALMNLQLKRPMKAKGESSSSNAKPKNTAGSQLQPNQGASTSSSLANAFGSFTGKKEESASPALSSANTTHSRGSSSHEESDADNRPSFKRLPSQTLGPANSKKAFYGYDEEEDMKNREMVGWGAGAPDISAPPSATVPDAPGGTKTAMDAPNANANPRTVKLGAERGGGASLADRRKRRMSAPGASLNLQSLPSPLPSSAVKVISSNEPMRPGAGGAYVPPAAGYAPAAQGGPVGK